MKTSFQNKVKCRASNRLSGRSLYGIVRSKYLLLILLAVLGLGTLQAQTLVQLTLKDALKYALEASQNARKARLDVENSQYKIDEVKARALPQLSGSGGITYNPILQQSALP